MKRFAQEMGATTCAEILGFILASPGGPEKYAAGGFKDGKCKKAVEVSVRAVIEALEG